MGPILRPESCAHDGVRGRMPLKSREFRCVPAGISTSVRRLFTRHGICVRHCRRSAVRNFGAMGKSVVLFLDEVWQPENSCQKKSGERRM